MSEQVEKQSFLGLEGLHVFITGAADAIGNEAIREFLDQGCHVTAYDNRPLHLTGVDAERFSRLQVLNGDVTDEASIQPTLEQAEKRFGAINVLVVNAGSADDAPECPVWELPLDAWEKTYGNNARGTFLAIKHYLLRVRETQQTQGVELDNLAIVVTETGTGSRHSSLVQRVRDDLARLNSHARINAVVPRLLATESAGTTAAPADVARTVAFLASKRAAGHISGQFIQVGGNADGSLPSSAEDRKQPKIKEPEQSIPRSLSKRKGNKIRVAVSIDLDAVSGWLGTNSHPDNILADYSAGFFAARVGVPRLLRMLKKLNLADRVTWFIPGHSAESFPDEVQQVVESGCEIGLHGYAHEGAYQMTVQQERDVLTRCIQIARKLTGKKPVGYRAPLYQLRESTLDLLEEFGFEYDASLTDHDCHPFFAPRRPALHPIDFSKPASSWMHPVAQEAAPSSSSSSSSGPRDRRPLVCVPCNWYMEDMTPMQFLPHTENSHGYVDVRVIENLWRERFLWMRENEVEPVFPLLMHPDTSGMAHVIGMLERMLRWLKAWEGEGEVEFLQTGEIARWWREKQDAA